MSRDTLATSTSVTYYFNRQVWKRLFKKVGETCWPNITKYEKGCCVLVLPWQIVLQGDLQTVNPDHLDFQSNFPRGIQHCPIKKMKDLVHKWRHKYVDIFVDPPLFVALKAVETAGAMHFWSNQLLDKNSQWFFLGK